MDTLRGTGRSTRGYLKTALLCCRNPGTAVEVRDHFPTTYTKQEAVWQVHRLLKLLNVPHTVERTRGTITVHPFKRRKYLERDKP